MARLHGRYGRIRMTTTGSPGSPEDADVVGSMTSWTLNMATDKVEVTAFGDSNKQYVQGLKDITGTFDGFFDTVSTNTLYNASQSADGVQLYLYPTSNDETQYFGGPAWVDFSVTTAVGDAVKVSGTFSANGTWTVALT